ncbi:MAG: SpoIIE family protein phosphatase [Rhodospirillales bacterium]|nr:SpoIIE family protein phosphatase [Rhodospirillales bacterium]
MGGVDENKETDDHGRQAAASIQQLFLPTAKSIADLRSRFGVHIHSVFQPAEILSGDMWGVKPIGDHMLAIYIMDTSGEETDAALSMVRAHTLIMEAILDWLDPAAVLFELNNKLATKMPVGQYVAMLCGIIDFSKDTFVYSGAGMPWPTIIEPGAQQPIFGDGSGLPLGIAQNATFQNRELPFPTGASLLLYSDGLNEIELGDGTRLGKEGVQRIIEEMLEEAPASLGVPLLTRFGKYSNKQYADDQTIVFCQRVELWKGKQEKELKTITSETKKTVVIADDEELARELLSFALENEGYNVIEAQDGEECLSILKDNAQKIDALLLDKNMPKVDGFDVLREVKSSELLAKIPVIVQTGASSNEEIMEGIKEGAYHYLTKPFNIDVMLAIVRGAIGEKSIYEQLEAETRQKETIIGKMKTGSFRFQTMEEVHEMTSILALACPDPQRAVVGLVELLANAVEHGNLGITYKEKGELVNSSAWDEEITRRLKLPENQEKFVEVTFTRGEGEVTYRIKDQGEGFDWRGYLEFDPERVTHAHGRGIAMASMLTFSDVTYLGKGNEVIARVFDEE